MRDYKGREGCRREGEEGGRVGRGEGGEEGERGRVLERGKG